MITDELKFKVVNMLKPQKGMQFVGICSDFSAHHLQNYLEGFFFQEMSHIIVLTCPSSYQITNQPSLLSRRDFLLSEIKMWCEGCLCLPVASEAYHIQVNVPKTLDYQQGNIFTIQHDLNHLTALIPKTVGTLCKT